MDKQFNGQSLPEFLAFLQETLIPDLEEAGQEYTALDFKTCVEWINHLQEKIGGDNVS